MAYVSILSSSYEWLHRRDALGRGPEDPLAKMHACLRKEKSPQIFYVEMVSEAVAIPFLTSPANVSPTIQMPYQFDSCQGSAQKPLVTDMPDTSHRYNMRDDIILPCHLAHHFCTLRGVLCRYTGPSRVTAVFISVTSVLRFAV